MRKVYDETDVVWLKEPKAKKALIVSSRDISPLPAILTFAITKDERTEKCGHVVSKLMFENAPFQPMNENFVFPGIPIFQQGEWVIILMDSMYPDDGRNANQWLFTYPVCRAIVEALNDIGVESLYCMTTTPPNANDEDNICEPFNIEFSEISKLEENGIVLPIELWLPFCLFSRFFDGKSSRVIGCNSRDYDLVSAERANVLEYMLRGLDLRFDADDVERHRVRFRKEGAAELKNITDTLKNKTPLSDDVGGMFQ
tara:strand:+ start:728 stop:1495 length:768 start_codon:yes stop_codon:yes gene_type:complete